MSIFLTIFGIAKKFGGWFFNLPLSEIVCIICACALVIEHIALLGAHRGEAKLKTQVHALSDELQKLSAAKAQQKVITQTNIVTVTKMIHDADVVAEKVEQAPPAPNCKTKPEVLGADI